MKKIFAFLLTAVLLVSTLSGCGSPKSAKEQKNGHSVLTVALNASPITLNILNVQDNSSTIMLRAIYEPMLKAKDKTEGDIVYADQGDPEPYLVKSYDVSKDGTVYTLHTNEKAIFANGDIFDADALIFTLDCYKGSFLYNISRIKSYKKVNDTTVEVTITEKNPDFLPNLINICAINPKQVKGGDLKWLDANTAGTGPYVIEKWEPTTEIVLKANKNYWNGAPGFEKIILRVIPEASNRTLLLNKGKIDVSTSIQTKDLNSLKTNPNLSVLEASSNRIAYFTFNSDRAPFDNKLLRQAISYAIPYDSLVNDVMEGHATRLISCMPPALNTAFKKASDSPYTYNLEKAKELLKQAGYPNGFSFNFLLCSGYKDYEDSAILIQSELAKIGIKMNIEKIEYATFLEKLKEKEAPQAFINTWTPFVPSPTYHIGSLFTSKSSFGRYVHFKNTTVDDLFAKAVATSDDKVFTDNMTKIQQIITEEAPWGYLYNYNQTAVLNKNLQGFKFYSDSVIRLGELKWKS